MKQELNVKEIKKRILFAKKLLKKTGKKLKKVFYKKTIIISTKQDNEIVTDSDIWVDETLQKKILKIFSDGWISEESKTITGKSDYYWILDPIDGTNNFSNKIPFFCISLALYKKDDTPAGGIILDPVHNEIYFSYLGNSYIEKNNRIQPVKTPSIQLQNSYISLGLSQHYLIHWEEVISEWIKLEGKVKASRKYGAAALEITYVGIGKLSFYYIMGFHIWDIAAALIFIKNAGAKYILDNNKNFLLVYNPAIEKELEPFINAVKNHH